MMSSWCQSGFIMKLHTERAHVAAEGHAEVTSCFRGQNQLMQLFSSPLFKHSQRWEFTSHDLTGRKMTWTWCFLVSRTLLSPHWSAAVMSQMPVCVFSKITSGLTQCWQSICVHIALWECECVLCYRGNPPSPCCHGNTLHINLQQWTFCLFIFAVVLSASLADTVRPCCVAVSPDFLFDLNDLSDIKFCSHFEKLCHSVIQ